MKKPSSVVGCGDPEFPVVFSLQFVSRGPRLPMGVTLHTRDRFWWGFQPSSGVFPSAQEILGSEGMIIHSNNSGLLISGYFMF